MSAPLRVAWLMICWIVWIGASANSEAVDDGPTPAAIAPVVNFDPGDEYADSQRMFQGISSLERSPGGRLWATWYGGGVTEDRHNYIMLVTSDDNGQTWSEMKLV